MRLKGAKAKNDGAVVARGSSDVSFLSRAKKRQDGASNDERQSGSVDNVARSVEELIPRNWSLQKTKR